MFFDHPSGGDHPPVRTEATIHAIYRKMFSLVKSMQKPDDIARSLIITLQGMFGSDGAVLCHVFDDGAKFVSAIGTLSHMEKTSIDLTTPIIHNFLLGGKAIVRRHDELSADILSLALYSRFQSVLLTPIAINGMPYGLFALVSNQPDYFEQGDADTIYQLSLYLSMLLENRAFELADREKAHYTRLGETCKELAPGLHKATIDLIQTFAQMRRFYVEQRYQFMAEHLSTAVGNIENMAKRIQDLRTLSDICLPSGHTFTTVQLKPTIQNVLEYSHAQIEETCELEVKVSDDLPDVHGDFTLIWQVLHELVENALRSMSRTPRETKHRLSIYAYKLPSSAAIEISDTGSGIAPADEVHIFDPFFSTWSPCKGLGLSRAQINMLRMNGNIFYHSRPEGGASFRIAFPDAQHAPQEEVF